MSGAVGGDVTRQSGDLVVRISEAEAGKGWPRLEFGPQGATPSAPLELERTTGVKGIFFPGHGRIAIQGELGGARGHTDGC
jgi:hypothetical protein